MKIAVAQINPIVGDLDGNVKKILSAYMAGVAQGSDIVVAPEMVLTGYPLEDLVLRPSFMRAVHSAEQKITSAILDSGFEAALIYGQPRATALGVENIAAIIDPITRSVQFSAKYELPNYGVFDEKRVFKKGDPVVIDWRGYKLGVMICEDAWFPKVSHELYNQGANILISINGSPFEAGKNVIRRQIVANRIKETGLPFLYANLVGGQDELVFDGGSFLYDGNTLQEAPYFKEGVYVFEANLERGIALDNYPAIDLSGVESIYQACVLGTRDYMMKQGFASAVIGYSGGVDSGIVAAIAADALGPQNVNLVRLPSKFSSQGSLDDASEGATRLGANLRTVRIEPIVKSLRASYRNTAGASLEGIADENIQARARAVMLMAISNQEHHLLLTTGNKSEISVGYCTIGGDMTGGFNPIKDVYKTMVWDICRWRNNLTKDQIADYGFLGNATEVVPESIIVKPPSAELRADQKDEDSLPPYPVLDAILGCMIEQEMSVHEIGKQLQLPEEDVLRIRNLVDRAEYKRRQAAPGVKITSKIHGRDRRYPIVNRWRG